MASIVLAFAVIRIAGPSEGGIFGFGFSTLGQQMFIISYFGIRPFHITDMKRQFSFSDYLLTRRITSMLAFLGSILFVSIQIVEGNYDIHKSLILVLLSLYKIIDGYADVYESELQRQEKLYRTGQSLAFRTSLSVLTLLLVLLVSGNLLIAVAAADVMQIMGTNLFAVRVLGKGLAPTAHEYKKSYELISSTALLFLSVFVKSMTASKCFGHDHVCVSAANILQNNLPDTYRRGQTNLVQRLHNIHQPSFGYSLVCFDRAAAINPAFKPYGRCEYTSRVFYFIMPIYSAAGT
jgi:hypothetical protein